MILLTPELRAALLANGRATGVDHMPVVRFFNPLGIGTWLATELDADGDTLFGLADLGEPELGSFSLSEMAALRLPYGMGIERTFSTSRASRCRPGPMRRAPPARFRRPSGFSRASGRRQTFRRRARRPRPESERGPRGLVTGRKPGESLSAARHGESP